jgi:purine-cytosine permease-like protein
MFPEPKRDRKNFCVLLCYTIIPYSALIKSKFYFVKRNERRFLLKIKLELYLVPLEKKMFWKLSEKNF